MNKIYNIAREKQAQSAKEFEILINSWRDSHPYRKNNLLRKAYALQIIINQFRELQGRLFKAQTTMAQDSLKQMARETFNRAVKAIEDAGLIDTYSRGYKQTLGYILNVILQNYTAHIEDDIFTLKAIYLDARNLYTKFKNHDSISFVTDTIYLSIEDIIRIGKLKLLHGKECRKLRKAIEKDEYDARFSSP